MIEQSKGKFQNVTRTTKENKGHFTFFKIVQTWSSKTGIKANKTGCKVFLKTRIVEAIRQA